MKALMPPSVMEVDIVVMEVMEVMEVTVAMKVMEVIVATEVMEDKSQQAMMFQYPMMLQAIVMDHQVLDMEHHALVEDSF